MKCEFCELARECKDPAQFGGDCERARLCAEPCAGCQYCDEEGNL